MEAAPYTGRGCYRPMSYGRLSAFPANRSSRSWAGVFGEQFGEVGHRLFRLFLNRLLCRVEQGGKAWILVAP
jgi:hypothetical protein